MSWQDESTEILRILINDFSNSPNYSDETLEQLLLASARYVVQEINLTTSYTVNFFEGSISPSPDNDHDFLNFMILKAACLTNTWAFNTKAIQDGILARCGPSELRVQGNADILLGLVNQGPCKTYQDLMTQYNFGQITVKGIFSPFTSNQFLPNNIGYINRGNY
jgi:hypothetical protein